MITCPTPLPAKDRILLGHGSGGKLSADLLREVFLPVFRSPVLGRLDDQAVLQVGTERLAFTTDSFVVKPLFFRGGDIGSLAVHGTVNDLAMGGAEPLYLSAAFIIEEGLSMDVLARIADSMGRAAEAAGIEIVTGDTKVVEKGSGDGVFINTTGIGRVRPGIQLSAATPVPATSSCSAAILAIMELRFCRSARISASTRPLRAIPPLCTRWCAICSPRRLTSAACATRRAAD